MSNRRRRRHPAAHLDGLHLAGSCCDTVVSIGREQGRPTVTMHHDDDCPAISGDDIHAALAARTAANVALSDALTASGITSMAVILG